MTPVEYECMLNGFVAERKRKDLEEWRRTRWLAGNIVNVVRGIAGADGIDLRKLLVLPDDPAMEAEASRYMTHERFEYLKERWSKKVN
mgnify:FL=1